MHLSQDESESLKRIPTHNLEAYELFARARATPYPPLPERIRTAREMFDRVIELDPEFAGGYAGVSTMLSLAATFGPAEAAEKVPRAEALARKAIEIDETFAWSYTSLGIALWHQGDYQDALVAAREAVSRQPNDSDAHAFLGMLLGLDAQYVEGNLCLNHAIRLNPQFVYGPYLNLSCLVNLLAEDYREAVRCFEQNIANGGPVGPPAICRGVAAYLGLDDRASVDRLLTRLGEHFPGFTLAQSQLALFTRDPSLGQRVWNQLIESGIPR